MKHFLKRIKKVYNQILILRGWLSITKQGNSHFLCYENWPNVNVGHKNIWSLGQYDVMGARGIWHKVYQCRRLKRCSFNPWVGKIPWSRKWQSTPVFLPGESHEQRSLAGYSPWGRTESDMTESNLTLALALASQLLNYEVRHNGNKSLFSPDLSSSWIHVCQVLPSSKILEMIPFLSVSLALAWHLAHKRCHLDGRMDG